MNTRKPHHTDEKYLKIIEPYLVHIFKSVISDKKIDVQSPSRYSNHTYKTFDVGLHYYEDNGCPDFMACCLLAFEFDMKYIDACDLVLLLKRNGTIVEQESHQYWLRLPKDQETMNNERDKLNKHLWDCFEGRKPYNEIDKLKFKKYMKEERERQPCHHTFIMESVKVDKQYLQQIKPYLLKMFDNLREIKQHHIDKGMIRTIKQLGQHTYTSIYDGFDFYNFHSRGDLDFVIACLLADEFNMDYTDLCNRLHFFIHDSEMNMCGNNIYWLTE